MNKIKNTEFRLLFCLLVLVLSGCSGDAFEFPEAATRQFEGAFVSKAGSIALGDSEYAADFGTLTVLENRKKGDSRLITLPVIRIHSNSQQPREPVFYFGGGPGQTNMQYLSSRAYLLPEHDLVVVGFRGVDGSSVLDCPEITEAMKGEGGLFSERSMKNIENAWSDCAKRLAGQGTDIDGYTMLDVIQDNELARIALGYERISLKSASYGTRVAYLYGLIHPEIIHRSVMVGVNPPGRFVWEPNVTDRQLRMISGLWADDPVMSLKTSDLYAAMMRVLKDMPESWLFLKIDRDKVKVVTFFLLWKRESAAQVFDAYVAADQGDPSGLAMLSLAYDFVVPGIFVWGDLASKAVSADYDAARNYDIDMMPPEFPFGAPMSMLLWGPTKDNAWPIKPIPDEFKKPQYSDVQTLLLSGSIDLGTPAEFAANDLLPYLNNGQQIVFSECGHLDIEWVNRENVKRIVTEFFGNGLVDTSLNSYVPMDFSVGWGFPQIAKVSLAAVATIAALILLFVIWISARLLKRKISSRIKT